MRMRAIETSIKNPRAEAAGYLDRPYLAGTKVTTSASARVLISGGTKRTPAEAEAEAGIIRLRAPTIDRLAALLAQATPRLYYLGHRLWPLQLSEEYRFMTQLFKRHPSAILLMAQILGVVLYPFIETSPYGQAGLNMFGLIVLGITINMVRRTPGQVGISAAIAVPVVVMLFLQTTSDSPHLLPWTSALEALFYFYAAASLIAYMMEDYHTTVDELFAAAATFTLLVWGFTHLFVLTQALQPGAYAEIVAAPVTRSWSELNHLSFALLSGTGMGNVIAHSAHARALASVEMMTGLMYLATVVARLIGFTMQPKK